MFLVSENNMVQYNHYYLFLKTLKMYAEKNE